MRALIMLIIGLTFGTGTGFLLAGGLGDQAGHDHAGHSDAGHGDLGVIAWDGPDPALSLSLTPDIDDAVNLQISVKGFTFDPLAANGPAAPGTGHAHVYVDGVKVLRAYSPFVHLADVPSGAIIRVTLNANDHSPWGQDGNPIAAEATAP